MNAPAQGTHPMTMSGRVMARRRNKSMLRSLFPVL